MYTILLKCLFSFNSVKLMSQIHNGPQYKNYCIRTENIEGSWPLLVSILEYSGSYPNCFGHVQNRRE